MACKYCDPNKSSYKNGRVEWIWCEGNMFDYAEVDAFNKKLYVSVSDNVITFNIDFCPKCGDKFDDKYKKPKPKFICPECGGTVGVFDGGGFWYVECKDCGAHDGKYYVNAEEATKSLNGAHNEDDV